MPQNCFHLVKFLIFYGSSKYVKMPPFWFMTEFNRAWVDGRVFVGKGGEEVRKKCNSGAFLGHVATQITYTRYCARYHTSLIVLKRGNVLAVVHLDTSGSETCIVSSVVCCF